VKRNLHAGGSRSRGLSVNVFTESELDDIHLATLEILERTGVFVEDDEALDIFKDGGCRVDRETRLVRIPPHVVEDAIRSAPSRYTLCGRDPKNDFVMEPGRVAFTNFSEGIRVIDVETGEYRDSTLQDIADIARVNDYLSELDTHEIAVGAKDVPPQTAAVHNSEAQLLNTTKPIGIGPLSGMECKAIFRMAAEIAGGEDALRERPILYSGVCPVSPLKLPRDATEVIIESSRWWIPDNILSMAMAGGSSPVTLAGTLVTHNAEVLSGIVLAQLTERGCPVMYGSSTTAMDLKLAAASVGSPEIAVISAAVAQMARRYLIPSFVAGL
jgi:trimethylamine--corrinoid protein Co-methyltransferase